MSKIYFRMMSCVNYQRELSWMTFKAFANQNYVGYYLTSNILYVSYDVYQTITQNQVW